MSGTPRVRYVMDHLNHDDLVGEPLLPEAPVDGEAYGRRNESWDRVLRLGGGRLDGALAVPSGSVANPGLQLGLGDGTGLSRSANAIVLSVQGSAVLGTFFNTAQFYVPLVMLSNRISSLGDATAAGDALNLRTGDARYLPTIGGTLVGDLRMTSASGLDAEISLYLGGRNARIYWGNAIVLRRGAAGESVYIENNNGGARSEVLTQLLGDGRYLQQSVADARYLQLIAGGIVAGPLQVLTRPVIANDAANKGYVDDAVAAAVVPTAFRTFAFLPNDFPIFAPSSATVFLDVNVTLPASGLRNVLISIDPVFASNEPTGTTIWELYYSTDLIALESPVVAYKIANTPTAFFRSSAKIPAAVDATSGSVRVVVRVRCTASGGSLTQVGVGGTMAPNMRTLVTVEDLGPV